MHGRQLAHAPYLTVQDARPLGNNRCMKVGPTHTHCDICFAIDGVLRRETARHVTHECPYSQIVIDPLLRSFASRYVADRAALATLPTAQLLSLFERLYTTGSTIETTIPAVVAANFAGSICLALFQRASRNAPGSRPAALDFSPRSLFSAIVRTLRLRAAHTRRLSKALDDNLIILHPGIDEWLEIHGHCAAWQKAWGAIASWDGLLIPESFDQAPVGNSGGCGAPLVDAHVASRLCLTTSYPHRVTVRLRLSVGLKLGTGCGADYVPADPHLDSWPLASDRPPEYRVEQILAERVLRGGTQYHVKWCNYDAPTWEPAQLLSGTDALARWQMRPDVSTFTFVKRGDLGRVDEILACPNLPTTRLHVFRNLRCGTL